MVICTYLCHYVFSTQWAQCSQIVGGLGVGGYSPGGHLHCLGRQVSSMNSEIWGCKQNQFRMPVFKWNVYFQYFWSPQTFELSSDYSVTIVPSCGRELGSPKVFEFASMTPLLQLHENPTKLPPPIHGCLNIDPMCHDPLSGFLFMSVEKSIYIYIHIPCIWANCSDQTSKVTPNGGLGSGNLPKLALNSGFEIIVICLDTWIPMG